jgi:GxxExxY protein
MKSYKHEGITGTIIKAFYTVYNTLGYGFLERVYQASLAIEIRELGLTVAAEAPIQVHYRDRLVGDYYADLLVADKVLVEIKAAQTLTDAHEAQLLNYLKATPYEVGLLLNFGPKPQVKRRIYDNKHKKTGRR